MPYAVNVPDLPLLDSRGVQTLPRGRSTTPLRAVKTPAQTSAA